MAGTVKVKSHKRNGRTVKGYIRRLGRAIFGSKMPTGHRARAEGHRTRRRMRSKFTKDARKTHNMMRYASARKKRKARRRTRVA